MQNSINPSQILKTNVGRKMLIYNSFLGQEGDYVLLPLSISICVFSSPVKQT